MRRTLTWIICLAMIVAGCCSSTEDTSTTSTTGAPSGAPTPVPAVSPTPTTTQPSAGRTEWTASTASGRISISGTVTDLTVPFTLDGVFQGGAAELTFVPADEHGGSYSYAGGGSGATVRGEGSYTLEGNEDEPLTLTYHGRGCASPGGCAETTAVVTLTPQRSE